MKKGITFGAFDLFHAGHVLMMEEAKSVCDYLIVCVQTDPSLDREEKKIIIDNLKTLFYALIIAVIIRSLLLQPFYIPSSSMEPTLLVGDRLFVTKYSYGYSKHSFPFSPPFLGKRILFGAWRF